MCLIANYLFPQVSSPGITDHSPTCAHSALGHTVALLASMGWLPRVGHSSSTLSLILRHTAVANPYVHICAAPCVQLVFQRHVLCDPAWGQWQILTPVCDCACRLGASGIWPSRCTGRGGCCCWTAWGAEGWLQPQALPAALN